MDKQYNDKIILVTGGTGSIGSVLVEKILTHNPKQLRIISRDENKQYYLMEKLGNPHNLRFFIGDVRDKSRLMRAFENVDVVFHTAALKHVPSCEYNPFEAVKTNILGSQNVIDAALQSDVSNVIAISTDKAVHPNNVMGISKLMMERLFISANNYSGDSKTRFSCVRFGNVAWANGSVLKLWEKQIKKDGYIKITDEKMTRFFMSAKQAMNLVLQATTISHGGEVFILKMPSIKIGDLARVFLKKYHTNEDIEIKTIGRRAGEKMHEQLLDNNHETGQIVENKEMIILTTPSLISFQKNKSNTYKGFEKVTDYSEYNSNDFLSIEHVEQLI